MSWDTYVWGGRLGELGILVPSVVDQRPTQENATNYPAHPAEKGPTQPQRRDLGTFPGIGRPLR